MTKNPKEKVLVLGAGAVGSWVARKLAESGYEVVGTTTNTQTMRALTCLGIEHLAWHWEPGVSWDKIEALRASRWVVTVPPRMGSAKTIEFHRELQKVVQRCGVKRLIWTSSTSVYDVTKSGLLKESDAGHHTSRHTGVDMFELEKVHHDSSVPFVAMRFGGLFSANRHPVQALLQKGIIQSGDGHVQWVHECDAAAACVFAVLHPNPLPNALNVVAPCVRTRRELIQEAPQMYDETQIASGGIRRKVTSEALSSLGFNWQVPDPKVWVKEQGAVTRQGTWQGPHGALNWTEHGSHQKKAKGCVLMVHGYKGFRQWGLWRGVAEQWASEGWDVYRMDFSHNGHVEPFASDCLDEEAWSQNRYHYEVEEVSFALQKLAATGNSVMVMGHSRGGGMAILGGRMFQQQGGKLAGCVLWSPVSDLFARFPSGADLKSWQDSDRLEVKNGRTGQIMVHPFAFYREAIQRKSSLNIQEATAELDCPILVIHGEEDSAVHWSEGKSVSMWSAQGSFKLIEGANHVFGMAHPWQDASNWPAHLSHAWGALQKWLNTSS